MSVLTVKPGWRKKHNFKGWAELWLILSVSWLTVGLNEPQQVSMSREYQVKAVFLFNFTQFVEWPPEAFPELDGPLVIGILGEDPFGSYLDEIVQGEKINDHPLVVRRFSKVEDIKECHILFINVTGKEELRTVLNGIKSQSILTVGDTDNFARNGGMIRFFTEESKIRIRVNLEPAGEAGLTISSKLLRLAEIVSSKNN